MIPNDVMQVLRFIENYFKKKGMLSLTRLIKNDTSQYLFSCNQEISPLIR